jgi:L-alanine-DL-glutamate epimerase-like enolase superfamily enzyme
MEPAKLVEEVQSLVAAGYQAVKLKVGETPKRDIARIRAVREALSSELVLLTDANTAYTLDDARAVMPAMDELGVGWLEEPFPALSAFLGTTW